MSLQSLRNPVSCRSLAPTRSIRVAPSASVCPLPKQRLASSQHLKSTLPARLSQGTHTSRASSRPGSSLQVHAWVDSQAHAQPPAETKRPADLTQAIAVAGFLAVRYGGARLDAHLILKALAALQLVVAAVAMTMRNVHGDRVTSVTAPSALALYALNYSRIPFMTSLIALFGYNLSEKLPGPGLFYYGWFASLVAALYYGGSHGGAYWYTAAISVLAAWRLLQKRGPAQAAASVATIAVSAYVVIEDAAVMWVLILVAAQILHSGLRTVLSPFNITL